MCANNGIYIIWFNQPVAQCFKAFRSHFIDEETITEEMIMNKNLFSQLYQSINECIL